MEEQNEFLEEQIKILLYIVNENLNDGLMKNKGSVPKLLINQIHNDDDDTNDDDTDDNTDEDTDDNTDEDTDDPNSKKKNTRIVNRRSIYKPSSQPIKYSTNKLTPRSENGFINRSIRDPTSKLSINKLTSRSVNRSRFSDNNTDSNDDDVVSGDDDDMN